MAEDLKKLQDEQLQDEQLDEVNGGMWQQNPRINPRNR